MDTDYDFYTVQRHEEFLYSIIQNDTCEIYINLPNGDTAQVAFNDINLFPEFPVVNYVSIDDINDQPGNLYADSKEIKEMLIESINNNDRERFIAESIKFYKSAVFSLKRRRMNNYFNKMVE